MTVFVVVELRNGVLGDVVAYAREEDAITHCAQYNCALGYEVDDEGLIADGAERDQATHFAAWFEVQVQ